MGNIPVRYYVVDKVEELWEKQYVRQVGVLVIDQVVSKVWRQVLSDAKKQVQEQVNE